MVRESGSLGGTAGDAEPREDVRECECKTPLLGFILEV